MSADFYGYHRGGEWFCEKCAFYCDSENYGDIEVHDDWHYDQEHAPKTEPKTIGVMRVANFLRVTPDRTESTSAFIQEDGNVVISAAWFHTLMAEAGWEKK